MADAAVSPVACATCLLDAVESLLHASRSEWVFLRELRLGTGRRNSSLQRLDAFALNCLPHTAMKRICYEVKVSRADFLCEVRQPLKRRAGMRFSNEFYFVTPPGLVDLSEVPVDCGLIEAGIMTPDQWNALMKEKGGFCHFDGKTGAFCMLAAPAPWRETPGPTWQLTGAMIRNQQRRFQEKARPFPSQQKFAFD